ncbi:hypothetical protein KCP71_14860 [Salmonella enterica subsp. enterica]|nr:hypothetical protein KCP71_14860 [Salmonella enterica subsp. enterica]
MDALLLRFSGAISFANTTFSDADFGVIGTAGQHGVICRRWHHGAGGGYSALLVAYNVLAKNKSSAEVQENSGAKE